MVTHARRIWIGLALIVAGTIIGVTGFQFVIWFAFALAGASINEPSAVAFFSLFGGFFGGFTAGMLWFSP